MYIYKAQNLFYQEAPKLKVKITKQKFEREFVYIWTNDKCLLRPKREISENDGALNCAN